jgi:protein involved in polysaccharide export with SLBB domain
VRYLGVLLLALVLCLGCAIGRGVRTELGLAQTTPGVAAVGDLMSARDRAELQALASARASGAVDAGYRIGPDDLLDIRIPDLLEAAATASPPRAGQGSAALPTVAESPVYQHGVRVAASGEINLPLLGLLRVEGLTPTALEQEIARRLVAAGILKNPQVSVLVAEYRSRVVAVIGSVERPGLYPVTRPGATVADLIWTAGGPSREAGRVVQFTPAPDTTPGRAAPRPAARSAAAAPAPPEAWLDVRDVRVEPAGNGRRVTIALTRAPDGLRDFALDDPPRLVIDLDGPLPPEPRAVPFLVADEVVEAVRTGARDGHLRAVLDLSRSGGAHSVRAEGATVVAYLGDTALDVPAGVSAPARPAGAPVRIDLEVLLHASGETGRALNPQVRPGDVITVAPAGSVLVDGWVQKPGSYPVTRGLTLSGAVAAAGGHLFPADRRHATVKRVLGQGEQRHFSVDLDAIAEGRAPDFPITDGDVVRVPADAARLIPWALWAVAKEMVHVGGSVLLF